MPIDRVTHLLDRQVEAYDIPSNAERAAEIARLQEEIEAGYSSYAQFIDEAMNALASSLN